MSSETTPHTEHYSSKSKMEGNIFPALLIAFGLAGIYIMVQSMI